MKPIDAVTLAARLHAGHVDKGGQPYLGHLMRVMLLVRDAGGDEDQQVAAVLHDSIEDVGASVESLLAEGVPPRAVLLVDLLSKRRDEDYFHDYLPRIKASKPALLVKLCDMLDNADPARLALLPPAKAERLRAKYQEAGAFLRGA